MREATLTQPIRYAARDPVERWLSALLCLEPSALDSFADFSSDYAGGGARGTAPHPSACRLFSVDRDALFSGHPAAEAFLARVAALLCAAHYKNAPDDLQILSDAPEHRLFALVAPEETEKITGEPAEQSSDRKNSDKKGVCGEGKNELLPRVLCVLQVAFEGDLGAAAVQQGFRERVQSPGDLIPWTLATQYQEKSFAGRLGVRVVRLATHPEVQQMGYGSRAVELLCEMLSREEMVGGRRGGCEKLTVGEDESVVLAHKVADHAAEVPPLLSSAAELSFGGVSWIGVSFGLTQSLFDFWAKAGFRCVHLRQSCNKLTGEHSCIMLKEIKTAGKMREKQDAVGVDYFAEEFFPRLLVLLSSSFRHLPVSVALTLASSAVTSGDATLGQLANSQLSIGQPRAISPPTYAEMIRVHLREGALRRARAYTKNLVDFSTVADVIPRLAELLFSGCFRGIKLSFVQKAFFVAIGLQRRRLEELASELDIGEAQLLGLFNKAMRKLVAALDAELKEDSEQAACKR